MGWLTGWSKRQPITITGGADGSQVDFQLLLSIAYDSDMLSDFSDLRFTDADGTTLINAWLESKTDGTSADVWVEFPTTPANGVEQTYYMYYGKADAVSDWDIGATAFKLGDDFAGTSGSAPDSNKWTIEKEGSTSAIVELDGGGNLHLAGEPNVISSGNAKSVASFTNGFLVELKRKYSQAIYIGVSIGNGVLQDMDNGGADNWWFTCQGDGYYWTETGISDHREYRTPSGAAADQLVNNTNSWGAIDTYETLNLIYDANGVMKWIFNGTEELSTTDTTYLNSSKYLLLSQGEYSNGDGGDQYIDWVFVRKYAANPPTYGFGSEESAPTGLTILDFERAIMRGAFRGIMRGVA